MDNQTPPPPLPANPAAAVPKQMPIILLVEDDPLLIKMYSTKFAREGFTVKNAGDGEEGLRMATEEKVDFMIVDVMMPKMSGSDMLVKLRQNPKTANIPAIVLTNLTQQEEAAKLKTLGVKEYLVKADLTPSEVVNKVKSYLQPPAA